MSHWAIDRDECGRRAHVLETNTDITQRKRAEEALTQSREQLRTIVEQADAGMAHADRSGRINFVNRRFCEIIGYDESEILGRDTSHFTHPDDAGDTLEMFRQLVKKARPFQLEKRYVRKDGSTIWVSVSASPVRGIDAKVQSAIAIVIDTTARKTAEVELQRSKQLLERLVHERTNELYVEHTEM
jgi:PAS domain S-box-containing protein